MTRDVLTVLAASLAMVVPATAQFAPGMDGRAIDANNQVGSGGRNRAVQQTFFNSSNLYVTGNVALGRSFQGFSPIRDSSSLFISLPTSGIGFFQRDTIGLGDVIGNRTAATASPFFNPAQTVTSIRGIQQGLNAPGSSVPRATTTIPQGDILQPYGARPGILSYGQGFQQPVVPNSSIYDRNNMPLINRLYETNQSDLISRLQTPPLYGQTEINTTPLGAGQPDPFGLEEGLQRDTNPLTRNTRLISSLENGPTSEEMLANSRDLLSPTSLAPKLFAQEPQEPFRDTLTGRALPPPPRYAAQDSNIAVDPASGLLTPISPITRRDRVSRIASNIADWDTGTTTPITEPGAEGVQDDQPPLDVPTAPNVAGLAERYEDAMNAIRPSDPFDAKDSESLRVNQLINNAEMHITRGEFYEASNQYNLAVSFEPENAYIRFDYAHALLAAGEYLTAVRQIESAVEMIPSMRDFRPDFAAFSKTPETIDIRRADLERRLARQEDYRLRFLLGYTEYYTGLEKFGLPNLKKAAAHAPAGSVIEQFINLIEPVADQPQAISP